MLSAHELWFMITKEQQNTGCFVVTCSKILLQACPSCVGPCGLEGRREEAAAVTWWSPAASFGTNLTKNRLGSTTHMLWEYTVCTLACGHPSLQYQ